MCAANWTFDADTTWDEIDPIFEDTLARDLSGWPQPRELIRRLPLNVYESEDRLILYADIPGLSLDDVRVQVSGHTLRIEGEFPTQDEEECSQIYFQERYGGRFRRSLALPTEIDASRLSLSIHDGVLKIILPKK